MVRSFNRLFSSAPPVYGDNTPSDIDESNPSIAAINGPIEEGSRNELVSTTAGDTPPDVVDSVWKYQIIRGNESLPGTVVIAYRCVHIA
jgi:hypothetical protein